MITFLQHKSDKYPPRTYENASADATIAFGFDFNTPGETLTKDAVHSQNKSYISICPFFSSREIDYCIFRLNEKKTETVNIAGNSLPVVIKNKFDQQTCDKIVFDFFNLLFKRNELKHKISLIRSGGQSGFDEAGLKAAEKLEIPSICLCPNGWKFINGAGETICDEKLFKSRFNKI